MSAGALGRMETHTGFEAGGPGVWGQEGKGAASQAGGNGPEAPGPWPWLHNPEPPAAELPHSCLSPAPSALQGPELWPEGGSGDQELAAVLVSWAGVLTPGLSSALQRSLTLCFQQTLS